MAGGQEKWYFTKEQLQNSASRKCGLDADKELAYRQQAANLIQDMGQRLQVSQLCINTAIVYMHRFYAFHSFTQFHRNAIAAAALFLAAKVEEQPRKLEYVIKVAHVCLHRGENISALTSEQYQEQAQDLVFNENVLLQTLGFDVAIDHPHTHVVRTCHLVKAPKDLAQTSYFMASNSLHLTTMCLQYKPTVVACFCIHLASKWSNWAIPQSNEGRHWFSYVDRTVTMELLEKLTSEFLVIFEKCPSRLKRKMMNVRAAADGSSPHANAVASSSAAVKHAPPPSDDFDKQFDKEYERERRRQPVPGGYVPAVTPAPPPPQKIDYNLYREKREREDRERRERQQQPRPAPARRPDGRPERPDARPERPEARPEVKLERPDNRSERLEVKLERPDNRPERLEVKLERPENRHERLEVKIERPDRPDRQENRPERPERPESRPERLDHRLERPENRLERPDNRPDRQDNRQERLENRTERPDNRPQGGGPDRPEGAAMPQHHPRQPNQHHHSKPHHPWPPGHHKHHQKPPHDHRHHRPPQPQPHQQTAQPQPQVQPQEVPQRTRPPSLFSPENATTPQAAASAPRRPPQIPQHRPKDVRPPQPTEKPPSPKKRPDATAAIREMQPPAILSPFSSPPPKELPKPRQRVQSNSEPELVPVVKKLDETPGYENVIRESQRGNPTKVKKEPRPLNGIETDPTLVSNLLKESLAKPAPITVPTEKKSPIIEIKKEVIEPVQPTPPLLPVKQEPQLNQATEEPEHKHKKEKKKKDKHKHKDRDKSKEERKKHKKDKERERKKEEATAPPVQETKSEGQDGTFRITIPRDKLSSTSPGLKIKIPKERLAVPPPPPQSSGLKIKISKEVLETSRKRAGGPEVGPPQKHPRQNGHPKVGWQHPPYRPRLPYYMVQAPPMQPPMQPMQPMYYNYGMEGYYYQQMYQHPPPNHLNHPNHRPNRLPNHLPNHPANHMPNHPANHMPNHPANHMTNHPVNHMPNHPGNHMANHPPNHLPNHPANHHMPNPPSRPPQPPLPAMPPPPVPPPPPE